MTDKPKTKLPSGKLSPEALKRNVLSYVGAPRPEVLIGPGVGEDAAVIKWPEGKYMVFASDPIVGAESGAGRLLVRINSNDIASKGGDPAYLTVTLILPPCVRWLKEGGLVAALVKPQFELGPHQTDKGVVRDPALRQQAVDKVLLFCQERLGLECLGVVPAAVKGPKGNQEYIVCLRRVGAGQVACGSEVEQ